MTSTFSLGHYVISAPTAAFPRFHISLTCSFQLRLGVRVNPRYFAFSTTLISCPLNRNFSFSTKFLLPPLLKIIISVFPRFRRSFFDSRYSAIRSIKIRSSRAVFATNAMSSTNSRAEIVLLPNLTVGTHLFSKNSTMSDTWILNIKKQVFNWK